MLIKDGFESILDAMTFGGTGDPKIKGEKLVPVILGEDINRYDPVICKPVFGTMNNPNRSTSSEVLTCDPTGMYFLHGQYIFKREGDRLTDENIVISSSYTTPVDAAFDPTGRFLVVMRSAGPYLYERSGDTFTKLPDTNFNILPKGTDLQFTSVAFDPTGKYLVIGFNQAPFIYVYENHNGMFIKIGEPDVPPTVTVDWLTFSPQGDVLVVKLNGSGYMCLYKHTSGSLEQIPNPDVLPASRGRCVFDPSGEHLLVFGSNIGGEHVWVYRKEGYTFTRVANAEYLDYVPRRARYAAFDSTGTLLVIASDYEAPYVHYYNKVDGMFVRVEDGVEEPNSATVCVLSADGTFLVTGTTMRIYKKLGERFAIINMPHPKAPNVSDPIEMQFSRSGKYLVLQTGSASPRILERVGDRTFTYMTTVTPLSGSSTRSWAISSDGEYFFLGYMTDRCWLMKRDGNQYVLAGPVPSVEQYAQVAEFDPSGEYLAIGCYGSSSDNRPSNPLKIYKRIGDSLVLLPPGPGFPVGTNVMNLKFSPTGEYLVANVQTDDRVWLFRRDGEGYRRIEFPSVTTTSNLRFAFDPSEKYLAVIVVNYSVLNLYKLNGDVVEELPGPDALPQYTSYYDYYDVAFDSTGRLMFLVGETGVGRGYAAVFRRVGDAFRLIGVVPAVYGDATGDVHRVVTDPLGKVLFISRARTPYLAAIRMDTVALRADNSLLTLIDDPFIVDVGYSKGYGTKGEIREIASVWGDR